jgi:hypothetical protein
MFLPMALILVVHIAAVFVVVSAIDLDLVYCYLVSVQFVTGVGRRKAIGLDRYCTDFFGAEAAGGIAASTL